MIRNDRQLAAAERKRAEALREAEEAEDFGNEVYRAFAADLEAEIKDYVSVRDGFTKTFEIDSFDDLASALVKARIARRWTHRQLAEALGVKEQMVQRDEAGGYERARLTRLADIADILGYELKGRLQPLTEEPGGAVTEWLFPCSPARVAIPSMPEDERDASTLVAALQVTSAD